MRIRFRHVLVAVARWVSTAMVVLAGLTLVALSVGPRTGRYQTATVLTGSMRPHMPEGSMVVITPMAARDVHVGDVVMYRIPVEDHRVVTHRVMQVVEGGDHPVIRTKGDANRAPDPWVAQIGSGPLWKVRFTIPKAGRAVHSLRQPSIRRLTVLGLPMVLCALWLGEIWLPSQGRRSDQLATDPA